MDVRLSLMSNSFFKFNCLLAKFQVIGDAYFILR
jgi:hypothetical protein